MSIHTNIFSVCNRLHLNKICLIRFVDNNLYSNSLSAIAMIYSSNILELFSACFSCGNNFNRSHISLGFSDKSIVEVPETMIAAELSNFISV